MNPIKLNLSMWRSALAAFLLASCGVAVSASSLNSSCATPDISATPTTCFFDLTASPSTTPTAQGTVLLNGGLFRVPGEFGDLGKGTIVGTGVFQPFVRIQESANGSFKMNGIESGYNTDGRDGVGQLAKEMDNHDKGKTNWNHSIRLSDIPKVTVCDGGGTTGNNCRDFYEFLLDVNEQGNSPNSGISLDEFKIFTASTGDLHAFTGEDDTKGMTNFNITGAVERYNMDASPGGDASILMDYSNFSGSGNGVDLQALVEVTKFNGVAADAFVYLYSKFGWTGSQCQHTQNKDSECMGPNGAISTAANPTKAGTLDFQVDAGFEEWSIRKKTPIPATLALLAIGIAGLAVTRSRSVA